MRHAAFVFDAYGTLFDVHAAVRRHAARIGPDGQLLSEIWRAKQLEYSWTRTLMGAYLDFWQLTEQALDFAFARVPSADSSPARPMPSTTMASSISGSVKPALRRGARG